MTVVARVEAEVVEMVQMAAVLVRIEGVVVEMEAVVVRTSRIDGLYGWTGGCMCGRNASLGEPPAYRAS